MEIKMSPANENGSIMVYVIIVLALVSIIGISAMNNSRTETIIATNEVLQKTAFFMSDGAIDLGAELLELNMASQIGFTDNTEGEGALMGTGDYRFQVTTLSFRENEGISMPTDSDRDLYVPANCPSGNCSRTNLRIGLAKKTATKGAALQQLAGYEGKAKGMSQGGGNLYYDIYSQHVAQRDNVTAAVGVRYLHVIGQE